MRIDPLERQIHKGVVQLLRLNAAPGVVWWHTANERRCTPEEGAFLKTMGVLAGVPDFTIIIPRNIAPAICFLEVKAPKGRLSPTQIDFAERVTEIGCKYIVAHSTDEAVEILGRWQAIGRAARAA